MAINKDRLFWWDKDCPRHHMEDNKILHYRTNKKGSSYETHRCVKCSNIEKYKDIPMSELYEETQQVDKIGRYATIFRNEEERREAQRIQSANWRARNKEKNQAYQREYQRAYKAKKRLEAKKGEQEQN